MDSLMVNGRTLTLDRHGHLSDHTTWEPAVANALSHVPLSAQHWEIIYFLREFYALYHDIPIMRLLVKAMRAQLGEAKANSIYLNQLFPDNFLRHACKVAGLPKPRHCL
jgi:tRNA 2-thiouridine synthesizing protein E